MLDMCGWHLSSVSYQGPELVSFVIERVVRQRPPTAPAFVTAYSVDIHVFQDEDYKPLCSAQLVLFFVRELRRESHES